MVLYTCFCVIHLQFFSVPRFKQRFEFVTPQCDHDFSVLDTLKVSDTVLFFISAATGLEDSENFIDHWGEKMLLTSFSQVSIFLISHQVNML